MAAVRRLERKDVVDALREAAAAEGLTLDEVRDLVLADALENPRLRDLLLIWGDTLEDEPAPG